MTSLSCLRWSTYHARVMTPIPHRPFRPHAMNRPRTVIRFINAAHVIDHMFMLIFPAAVLGMAGSFDLDYAGDRPVAGRFSSPSAPVRCRPAGWAIPGAGGG